VCFGYASRMEKCGKVLFQNLVRSRRLGNASAIDQNRHPHKTLAPQPDYTKSIGWRVIFIAVDKRLRLWAQNWGCDFSVVCDWGFWGGGSRFTAVRHIFGRK